MPSPARDLPYTAVTTWILILAALAFLAIGLRAVTAPDGAAAFFGLPLSANSDGLAFVRVFGARNIGLSIVAIALVVLDARRGVAVLLGGAALIAMLDFTIVATHADLVRAAKHAAYMVMLGGFAVWTARLPGPAALRDAATTATASPSAYIQRQGLGTCPQEGQTIIPGMATRPRS